MPIPYRVKNYLANTYYHVYNRGVDGRQIYIDEADYQQFESYLERYTTISRADGKFSEAPSRLKYKNRMSLAGEIAVVAFCLMPNHFHLLIHQKSELGVVQFMRRVLTGYVMYFNRRHKRRGPLFETNYLAVEVVGEEKLQHMTRFIHLNPVIRTVRRFGPVETVTGSKPGDYAHSSYNDYISNSLKIGQNSRFWIKKLSGTLSPDLYQKWVDDARVESDKVLKGLTIDSTE